MRRYLIRLFTAAAAVVFLAVGAASPALATTNPPPRIQTAGMGGSWNDVYGGFRIRPHTVFFGSFYLIKRLYYRHYNHRDAYGHGRLVIGSGACCVNTYRASAYFYGVRQHAGIGRYFKYLRLRWRSHHRSHSKLLWISSAGAWTWRY